MWKVEECTGFTEDEIVALGAPNFKSATAAYNHIRLNFFANNVLELRDFVYSEGGKFPVGLVYSGVRDNGVSAEVIITEKD